MKLKLKKLGRADPPANDTPNLVNKSGIWVHQGILQEEIDPVEYVRKVREERLQHLLSARK